MPELSITQMRAYAIGFLLFLAFSSKIEAQYCTLTCDTEVQISLNQDCEAEVFYTMVLEDPDNSATCSPNGPTAYVVQVMDENNEVIPTNPIITCDYIGQTLAVKVKHWATGNTCWSSIIIEDKQMPVLQCQSDTIYCNQNSLPISEGGDAPMPAIFQDACETAGCSTTTLDYEDEFIDLNCSDVLIDARINRTWTMCDASGNCNTCTQEISLQKIDINDANIVFPPNFDGVDDNPLPFDCADSCDYSTTDCTGVPLFNGLPLDNSACSIMVSFEDSIASSCIGNQDIIRRWLILDTCNDIERTHNQIILIRDTTPPVIVCGEGFDYIDVWVDPTPNSCGAILHIPSAIITDNCSSESIEVTTEVFKVEDTTVVLVAAFAGINGDTTFNVGFGTFQIVYTATDACGNTSSNIDNPCIIEIEDPIPPTPVCVESIQVTLSPSGTAQILANTLNVGSVDNCCIGDILARRMDNPTGDFTTLISFSCDDIDTAAMVVLRIYDCSGNYADCMVEVWVRDKTPPKIDCPGKVWLECADIGDDGQIDANLLGIPDAHDPCGSVETTHSVFSDERNNCGIGIITIEWQAIDSYGNGPSYCFQEVEIVQSSEPIISFPQDITIGACTDSTALLPASTGEPEVQDGNCRTISNNYFDELLEPQDSFCMIIGRTWVVIDWCIYDQLNPEAGGRYEAIQKIFTEDNEPPLVTCPEMATVCITEGCDIQFEVPTISVTDCSEVSISAQWNFTPHPGFDGSFASGISSQLPFQTLPFVPGNLEVIYEAEDACGNISSCTTHFRIEDCSPPNVHCVSNLDVVLDETGQASIFATALDEGSEDNCGSTALIYSFMADTIVPVLNFTCENTDDTTITLWVTDPTNNQHFCKIPISIEDTLNVCDDDAPDTSIIQIHGLIRTENDENIQNTTVMVQQSGSVMNDMITDNSGYYQFMLNQEGVYTILPEKDTDIDNGISTFDIVLMQQHILGINLLNTPYKMLAADINRSSSITAYDIILVRQVVLGLRDDFPNNKSWRFMPSDFAFSDPTNPFLDEIPEFYTLNSLTENISINFMGIKIGDINGSANPDLLTFTEDRHMKTRRLGIPNIVLEKGQEQLIDIKIKENDIIACQFVLNFDPSRLELLDIISTKNTNANNFGLKNVDEGEIKVSWNAAQPLAEDQVLFQLKLKAKETLPMQEIFAIQADQLSAEAYTRSLETTKLVLYWDVPVSNEVILKQNNPNPFAHSTVIEYFLPNATNARLVIYDLSGKVYLQSDAFKEAGTHRIEIKRSQLPESGVLFYRLETGEKSITKKMIIY